MAKLLSVNAVVLLSGGLDSATTLAIARSEGLTIHALTVAYGQRHSIELESASRVAAAAGVKEHKRIDVALDCFGGSALTDDIAVPKDRLESEMEEIPATYVPARNTVMLSLALAYAEVVQAQQIFIGVNAVDYSGYPDCRPEFIEAFDQLAQVATKSGIEGLSVRIRAPLLNMRKREIIETGLSLGVDYSLTHSCYDPIKGRACGRCDSCTIRRNAFEEVGVADPALRHLVDAGA